MKIEPAVLIRHALRAGLTLKRTEEGTILVLSRLDTVPEEWLDMLRLHKPALLPLLPLYHPKEKAKPQQAPPVKQTQYGLKALPKPSPQSVAERQNYDLFDGFTPLQRRPRKHTATGPQTAAPVNLERNMAWNGEDRRVPDPACA